MLAARSLRVGLGAWQYPGEKEITFPPYTCLEAHGDARLERDAKGNEVIIFPLKVMLCRLPSSKTVCQTRSLCAA